MSTGWAALFSRALGADPDRLHFAAHSHHLWPDAAFEGAAACMEDAARLADRKWGRVFGEILPALQRSIAAELSLTTPQTITFAPNTHEFVVRIASSFERKAPLRILTTDGEFHSFARQCRRWEEAGEAIAWRVPVHPAETLSERIIEAAHAGAFDWCFVSQVFFGSGVQLTGLKALAETCEARDIHLTLDGYHGYMAVPTDLSDIAGSASYLSGGYKYAMAGENACFLHMPDGVFERPVNTGWFAAFDDLAAKDQRVTFQSGGARFAGSTFDPVGLYRALFVRQMLDEEGLTTARISQHAQTLQHAFLTDLQGSALAEAALLTPLSSDFRARFLAFRHPKAAEWQAALMEKNIITDVRADVIRFGFGLYQTEPMVERLLEALRYLR